MRNAAHRRPLVVYVLTKNEARNITRCLDSLAPLKAPVHVLDSGSTDATLVLAAKYGYVSCEAYEYRSHFLAYREILARHSRAEYVMILDADMALTSALAAEVKTLVAAGKATVARAPIAMWWNGAPLPRGSLCPPKPFLFRGGQDYFVAAGHGEKIGRDVQVCQTQSSLIHDDRKPYQAFLSAQARYAQDLVARSRKGDLTWRDRLRVKTPAMLFIVPFWSAVMRSAFLSGKTGWVYVLDRLIAEAIMFREVLARSDDETTE